MLKATTLSAHFLQENFWLAESTRETNKRAFEYFVMAIGNRTIDRIEPNDGEKYKGWLLKTGRSKTTANIYLRSVRRVLNWAVETKKLITVNPLRGIKEFRITRNPVMTYEDWQVERMIRLAPTLIWKGLILCAWTTGLRRSAILNLTIDNIRDGFIYVEPKRNTKDTWEWQPKDKEKRKVPIVTQLQEIFDLLEGHYPFLTQKRYANMIRLNGSGLLKESHRKCPDQNFRRVFVAIQRMAFGRQIGDFHQFRKTFTTNMCGAGLPEYFVMRLTGHSNLKTMTYYLASRESYFEEARKIASECIKSGPSVIERPLRKEVSATTPDGR